MNYSQRKYIERLMAEAPGVEPLSLSMPNTLFGMRVIETPDVPRYTLPVTGWPARASPS